MNFDRLLQLPVFRNSLVDSSIALAITLGSLVVLFAMRRLVRKQHARMRATPKVELLELPFGVLSSTNALFFVAIAVYLGLKALTMGASTRHVVDTVIVIAMFLQAGVWSTAIVAVWLDRKRNNNHI